jgi:hypothetical protein
LLNPDYAPQTSELFHTANIVVYAAVSAKAVASGLLVYPKKYKPKAEKV